MADDTFTPLKTRLAEVSDLRRAGALLHWDQQVMMPRAAAPGRAEQLATLDRKAHELFVSPETGRLLESARAVRGLARPRVGRRERSSASRRLDYEKASRVPSELRAELTRAASQGYQAWQDAKAASDFERFLPALERNVELKRRYVECFDPVDEPYDILLDDYERGMTTAEVRAIFDGPQGGARAADPRHRRPRRSLRSRRCSRATSTSTCSGRCATRSSTRFGFRRGDVAARPDGASVRVRRRRRRHPDHDLLRPDQPRLDLRDHARVRPRAVRAPGRPGSRAHAARLGRLARPARVAEPHVGEPRRTQPAVLARLLRARAGATSPRSSASVELERWFAAVNRVHPSLIRIHADEVTYNMHVILRFELEQEIVNQRIELRDLPEAWNARMDEYLGIEVPSDAEGVLQDVHWSGGSIGYFSTYSLGNVMSLQIWERVLEELPDV